MQRDRRHEKRTVLYRARVPGSEETHEVEYDSVADALHFACRDLRAERRRPLQILEDGEEVLGAEQIERYCAEEWEEVEQRLEHAGDEEEGRR